MIGAPREAIIHRVLRWTTSHTTSRRSKYRSSASHWPSRQQCPHRPQRQTRRRNKRQQPSSVRVQIGAQPGIKETWRGRGGRQSNTEHGIPWVRSRLNDRSSSQKSLTFSTRFSLASVASPRLVATPIPSDRTLATGTLWLAARFTIVKVKPEGAKALLLSPSPPELEIACRSEMKMELLVLPPEVFLSACQG